jgi:2,3-bisphosphoglycerate-dependent phosphoglycerate mutase
MSGTLVLVRHGQSEWNLKNLFTGWKDPDLTELGIEEAKTGAEALKATGLKFDIAFTSNLIRAQPAHAGPDHAGHRPDRSRGDPRRSAQRA